MVNAPITLWECIEHAPRHYSLKAFLAVRLLYPRGWAVYKRCCLESWRTCPESRVTYAVKRRRGRPNREDAALLALWNGASIHDAMSVINSDMIIADAYLLIVKHWGFPQRQASEALGKAAAEVLGRLCPDGLPLGGDRVKQLAEESPLIKAGAYRRRQTTRENVARFRPMAIQGCATDDLLEICRRVLECNGRSPSEWEDPCVF